MNDVHAITARKLRSLATVIRAERYAAHEFGVRDAMEAEAVVLEQRADSIEEQAKPAIEEPQEFGSLIRARFAMRPEPLIWQRAPHVGIHYWMNAFRDVEVWSELTDVKVLRVGLGESKSAEAECDRGIRLGKRTMAQQIHQHLEVLLSRAITSERKNALEKAIQAVEELAP